MPDEPDDRRGRAGPDRISQQRPVPRPVHARPQARVAAPDAGPPGRRHRGRPDWPRPRRRHLCTQRTLTCIPAMGAAFFDGTERAQLCDLLGELGPGAPTLIAPWAARDLAAHLVLREREPAAGPGLVLPGPWRRKAEQRQCVLAGI